jgi:ABC-type glycerol-3-phosphate transport system permease component
MDIPENINKNKTSIFSGSIFGYTWRSRAIVFVVNILTVVIFGIIGFYLAVYFNKNTKLFTIISIGLSFPVSQFIIYKKLTSKKHE